MSKEFVEACSAGAGAACSMLVIYPLDITKVKLQSSHNKNAKFFQILTSIFQKEGLSGLFVGIQPKILESTFGAFFFFYWYSTLKSLYQKRIPKISTTANLLIATVAGIINAFFILPLDILTTRIQTQKLEAGEKRKNFFGMISQLYKEAGFPAFWRGFSVAAILCSNPAINYTAFETIKRKAEKYVLKKNPEINLKSKMPILSPFQIFLIGMLAKAIATIVTYPLIRAKLIMAATPSSKKQEQQQQQQGNKTNEPIVRVDKMSSLGGVILEILRLEGFWGLYKGCKEQIGVTVMKSAFLMMNKEYIHAFVLSLILARKKLIDKQ